MSVQGILKVIRNHTGAHASDTVKITHAEVEEMIHSAEDHHHITGRERSWLISALFTFGGTDLHPDIFSSAADKAALAATAVKGIETAAKFATQSARDQRDLLYWGVIIGGGERVGFTKITVPLGALPQVIQSRIAESAQTELAHAGADKFDPAQDFLCTAIAHGGQTYGYSIDYSLDAKDASGLWVASLLLGQGGARLKHVGYFEPAEQD
jgi:hypothetical protein